MGGARGPRPAQHGVQGSALLADAASRGDEVRVAALVGEGVGGAPGRHAAVQRALPPPPLLLRRQQLLAVLLDLHVCKDRRVYRLQVKTACSHLLSGEIT